MTLELQILLVAHGNMKIPPNGWGAVESLIYEYYIQLARLGHVVTILNINNTDKIIEHISSTQYDYIHFHNDMLINIVDMLPPSTNIAITSHYPYIHDSRKWNDLGSGYDYGKYVMGPLVHYTRKNNKIHVCAVSQKDYDAFVSYGVPPASLSICLNGVNVERFAITETPNYPAKSICLAQVMKRKRQNLFCSLPNVVCVGKVNDPSMVPSKEQYLGEWSDEDKYRNLTEYGSAILLSDGENGTPLSIKESLASGLGVVVSTAVSYELPNDWPWVRIVSESKLHDKEFIRKQCEDVQEISKSMRYVIRAYTKTLWDWSSLVPQYVDKLKAAFQLV